MTSGVYDPVPGTFDEEVRVHPSARMSWLVREAEAQEFEVKQTRKGGWIFARDGVFVTIAETPTDVDGWRNLKRNLVSAGFVWPE